MVAPEEEHVPQLGSQEAQARPEANATIVVHRQVAATAGHRGFHMESSPWCCLTHEVDFTLRRDKPDDSVLARSRSADF